MSPVTGIPAGAVGSGFELADIPTNAAANVPSLRALGTGAAQAAPGNGVARVLVYTAGAYPARPTGLPAGLAIYKGPVAPSDWVEPDEWLDTSP